MYNNYEERIELLNKQLVAEYKRAEELQARIDKGIALLNKHSIDCFEKSYDNNDFSEIMNIIIKILKGENNE